MASSFVVASGAGTPASAYCILYNMQWNFNIQVSGSPSLNGQWGGALGSAVERWSNLPGTGSWVLDWVGVNSTAGNVQFFRYGAAPGGGYAGAPGATNIEYTVIGATAVVYDGDIYLNDNWTWNTVGTMNQAQMKADVGTVATHEVGHEVVLEHPYQCGSVSALEENAAMTAKYLKQWFINQDDRDGADAQR